VGVGSDRKPAELATGVDSPKEAMVPSGEAREMLCFGASVYQALPSTSTASPSGSDALRALSNSLDLPIAQPSDGVGRFEREPHRPVRRRRDGDRDVGPVGQSDLLDAIGI
jgi:hypothetical protein